MEDLRFDTLVRSLATPRSRRGVARLLGSLPFGGVLTGLGIEGTTAGDRLGGEPCTRNRQCQTKTCLNPDNCDCGEPGCACTCACSKANPKVGCAKPSNPCKKAVCTDSGRCRIRPNAKKNGDSCAANKICRDGKCINPCKGENDNAPCRVGFVDGVCCDEVCIELGKQQNCTACGDACELGTEICGGAEEGCCLPSFESCDPDNSVDRCCGESTCTGENANNFPICCGLPGEGPCFEGTECCSGSCQIGDKCI
jgi:hypothetical protein